MAARPVITQSRHAAHKRRHVRQDTSATMANKAKISSANGARGSLFGCSRAAAARSCAGKPTQRLEPSTKDADQLADVGQRRLETVRKGRFTSFRTLRVISAAPLSASR